MTEKEFADKLYKQSYMCFYCQTSILYTTFGYYTQVGYTGVQFDLIKGTCLCGKFEGRFSCVSDNGDLKKDVKKIQEKDFIKEVEKLKYLLEIKKEFKEE